MGSVWGGWCGRINVPWFLICISFRPSARPDRRVIRSLSRATAYTPSIPVGDAASMVYPQNHITISTLTGATGMGRDGGTPQGTTGHFLYTGREMHFHAVDATSKVSSAGQCDKKSPSLPVPQLDICVLAFSCL